MIAKVAILVACCVAVNAFPADPYGKGHFAPMPYSFSYGVNDPYKGADYGQNEKSDGKRTTGTYSVQLPDGRKQTVDYIADHDQGFIAKVSYQGTAKYPSHGAKAITFAPSTKGGYEHH